MLGLYVVHIVFQSRAQTTCPPECPESCTDQSECCPIGYYYKGTFLDFVFVWHIPARLQCLDTVGKTTG